MKELNILLGLAQDKISKCEEDYMLTNTNFLNLKEQSEVLSLCKKRKNLKYGFFGGYNDAERAVAVFLPEYIDAGDDLVEYFKANEEDSPIALIEARLKTGAKSLNHRDYLGSLMGLGIKREKIGDIIVSEERAQIFVLKELVEFILFNYEKVGRENLSLQVVPLAAFENKEANIKVIKDTVASLRLDNVLSAAFGISRTKAAEGIKRGIVFVNNIEMSKSDFMIKAGDVLVLRGLGKAVLSEVGGTSRKDRIYLTIKRYV